MYKQDFQRGNIFIGDRKYTGVNILFGEKKKIHKITQHFFFKYWRNLNT